MTMIEKFRTDIASADDKIGVDEDAGVIFGYVVCEEGKCKTPGRGEFDLEGLTTLVTLGNGNSSGIRQRFQHPTMSDDGLGSYVSRAKNFRLDERDGRKIIRADAHFTETALTMNPTGGEPLGKYLLRLAKTDPGGFQSSIVMDFDKLEREDDNGKRLPPIFRPTKLWASDFVDEGDAVHGDIFGSSQALELFMDGSDRRVTSKVAAAGGQYLKQVFPDKPREFIEERFNQFRDRCLDGRFGSSGINPTPDSEESSVDKDVTDALAKQDEKITELGATFGTKLDSLSAMLTANEEARKSEDEKRRKAAEDSRNRGSEIAALCKKANYPDVEQLIGDESLSVDDAMKKVFSWQCERSGSLGVGGIGDGGGEPTDPVEKLRNEFSKNAERYGKAGYKNREDWVRHQCRDKGLEYKKPA